MAKLTPLLSVIFCLLLLSSFSHAARPHPKEPTLQLGDDVRVEGCEGVGEEKCLERRTLTAHLDYIYTQEKHH